MNDRETFCPEKCEKCNICKDVATVFQQLHNSYFFKANTSIHMHDLKFPFQPALWRVFNSTIDKNTKNFYTEIAKSFQSQHMILGYNGKIH